MRIHHLYVDESGASHFRDIEVQWAGESPAGKLSAPIAVTEMSFREVPADYDLPWHPEPARQYVINLDAAVRLTASDGETRVIGSGEVLLVEDVWGKGHLSQAVDGAVRRCIVVRID